MQFYQTYSKSKNYFTRDIILEHGKGSHVWDTEGNEYYDYTAALGPVVIGMNNECINRAIIKQLAKGISFSTPTRIEQKLCEKLISIIPGAEAVKLMKNGKDVTMAAVRLARAFTGRDMILKASYHGCDCWTIATEPGCKGIPQAVKDLSIKFKYNDIQDLEDKFTKYFNQIAGVILEPVMQNGPKEEYLEAIKAICHKNGAVLIFDEVVSSFRFALGGAAEYYHITPDLTCVGKALGGGMPISAICGRNDIMDLIDTGKAFISTTFGGECLSIAAALATIGILEQPGTYEHIWSMGQLMLDGLQHVIEFWGLQECISTIGMPPHCGLSFKGIGSLDHLDLLSIYEETMLDNGIIVSDTGFIMLSHTKEDIKYFNCSANNAMSRITKAIQQDNTEGILKGRRINPVFKRR